MNYFIPKVIILNEQELEEWHAYCWCCKNSYFLKCTVLYSLYLYTQLFNLPKNNSKHKPQSSMQSCRWKQNSNFQPLPNSASIIPSMSRQLTLQKDISGLADVFTCSPLCHCHCIPVLDSLKTKDPLIQRLTPKIQFWPGLVTYCFSVWSLFPVSCPRAVLNCANCRNLLEPENFLQFTTTVNLFLLSFAVLSCIPSLFLCPVLVLLSQCVYLHLVQKNCLSAFAV